MATLTPEWAIFFRDYMLDALRREVDFHGMFQLPAAVCLHTAGIHSIHHRGQLSMYPRPMGAKVPAIYGESYDSAQARLAATKA